MSEAESEPDYTLIEDEPEEKALNRNRYHNKTS